MDGVAILTIIIALFCLVSARLERNFLTKPIVFVFVGLILGAHGLNLISLIPEAESIKAEVLLRKASSDAAILERFRRAKAEGDFPDHIEPAGLVSYLSALCQGLALQAGGGASAADLRRLVDTTLSLWPGK